MCGNDYTSPGRCFVAINESLNWHAANGYCRTRLMKPGFLALIEDQKSQDLVASMVKKEGWDSAWINGCKKDSGWFWQPCDYSFDYVHLRYFATVMTLLVQVTEDEIIMCKCIYLYEYM